MWSSSQKSSLDVMKDVFIPFEVDCSGTAAVAGADSGSNLGLLSELGLSEWPLDQFVSEN